MTLKCHRQYNIILMIMQHKQISVEIKLLEILTCFHILSKVCYLTNIAKYTIISIKRNFNHNKTRKELF